jgi:hypothetical protein
LSRNPATGPTHCQLQQEQEPTPMLTLTTTKLTTTTLELLRPKEVAP